MKRKLLALVGIAFAGLCVLVAVGWDYLTKTSSGIPITRALNGSMPSPASRSFFDFGMVRGGSHHEHTFEVRNDGGVSWTPIEIRTSCACAGAFASRETVKSGDHFVLKFKYRAPQHEGADNQHAWVIVKELGDTPLLFEIHASVFHDLSVFPTSVTIPSLAKGRSSQRILEVLNNSDEDWEGISAIADVPWLKADVQSVQKPSLDPRFSRCRQRWHIPLTVYSDRLKSGGNTGALIIKANATGDALATTVPVAVTTVPELEVIPDQVFLGELSPNEKRTFSLLLRFSQDRCPKDASALKVWHDLGEAVICEFAPRADTCSWTLTCHIDSKRLFANHGYARGTIQIAIDKADAMSIQVPFFAKVSS